MLTEARVRDPRFSQIRRDGHLLDAESMPVAIAVVGDAGQV
jgi:hypothetical protein